MNKKSILKFLSMGTVADENKTETQTQSENGRNRKKTTTLTQK